MSRRALITGIAGQDGSYLAELLLEKDYEVHGVVRRSSSLSRPRIDPQRGRLSLHYGDMTDSPALSRVIAEVEPDEIYNLAAQSHVGISYQKPSYTLQANTQGVLNLLEILRELNKKRQVRFYQASTSEMFGGVPGTAPQSESTPYYPKSPYACSKVAAHHLVVNYREAYDLFACCGILFNHESPRRGENFVSRKITRTACRIKLGLESELRLGNLDAKRDWGYAKDYAEAMWLMLQQETPADFVIATGETTSVRDFVELTFRQLKLDPDEFVQIDPRFFRPAEVGYLQGDASKAKQRLGWEPRTSLAELVRIMVEADMALANEELRAAASPGDRVD